MLYLTKGKGSNGAVKIDMENSRCPLLHNIYLVSAAEYSDSSPCTNHPLKCPECSPLAPAVWKYNFKQHLLVVHQGVNLAHYEDQFKISAEEKSRLELRWTKRHDSKRRGGKKKKSQLAISDGYTARLALRYVEILHRTLAILQLMFTPSRRTNPGDEGAVRSDESEAEASEMSTSGEDEGLTLPSDSDEDEDEERQDGKSDRDCDEDQLSVSTRPTRPAAAVSRPVEGQSDINTSSTPSSNPTPAPTAGHHLANENTEIGDHADNNTAVPEPTTDPHPSPPAQLPNTTTTQSGTDLISLSLYVGIR